MLSCTKYSFCVNERKTRGFHIGDAATKFWRARQKVCDRSRLIIWRSPLGIMLTFDARVKNSDAAQPRVTNVKTPTLSYPGRSRVSVTGRTYLISPSNGKSVFPGSWRQNFTLVVDFNREEIFGCYCIFVVWSFEVGKDVVFCSGQRKKKGQKCQHKIIAITNNTYERVMCARKIVVSTSLNKYIFIERKQES